MSRCPDEAKPYMTHNLHLYTASNELYGYEHTELHVQQKPSDLMAMETSNRETAKQVVIHMKCSNIFKLQKALEVPVGLLVEFMNS